jgi:hypothetical protein
MNAQVQATERQEQQTVDPLDALRAELAREQAELDRVEDERAKANEQRDLKEKIAAAKRRRAIEEKMAELEAHYGPEGKEIARVETIEGFFVVKVPDKLKYRKWLDDTKAGSDLKSEKLRELVRPCVVHPAMDEADRILDKRPGILIDLTNACVDLARGKNGEMSGK